MKFSLNTQFQSPQILLCEVSLRIFVTMFILWT